MTNKTDLEIMHELGIHNITISVHQHDESKKNKIYFEFSQFMEVLEDSPSRGNYTDSISHHFKTSSMERGWKEIQRRATAYHETGINLAKENPND